MIRPGIRSRVLLLAGAAALLAAVGALAQTEFIPMPARRPPAAQTQAPVDPSVFTVARLQYSGGGDWYWGSSAIPNLLDFIDENVGLDVNKAEVRIKPSDPRLFSYPFIFSTGHGNIRFTDDEVVAMRRYLTGGGFWLANDSYGMDASIRRELKRIFPDRDLVELPFSHEIYQSPFQFPGGLPKIHRHDDQAPRGYAILDGDRVVVFYVHESDIGDGWEDPQVHKDPPAKRLEALRMGANIAYYALTH
ncbi:MAG TPA: DUF4159 domain-containing protein [bacterium]|nr:DUF4159 domain-containing protein [bacterium]